MPLKTFLNEVMSSVPGALGAILVDWEGEMVDQISRMDAFELKVIGAHKGIILNLMRQSLHGIGASEVQEIIVTTDATQTLIMPITSDYFLVFTMERGDELLGRARFLLDRCASRLRREIA